MSQDVSLSLHNPRIWDLCSEICQEADFTPSYSEHLFVTLPFSLGSFMSHLNFCFLFSLLSSVTFMCLKSTLRFSLFV